MKTNITVHVPTASLDDARHTQGALFKPAICALLNDGNVVKIETHSDTKTFKTEAEFVAWFDGQKTL